MKKIVTLRVEIEFVGPDVIDDDAIVDAVREKVDDESIYVQGEDGDDHEGVVNVLSEEIVDA